MPESYDNTNRGALWKVADRKTENHPTHTGHINIAGVDHYLSAWVDYKPEGNRPTIKLSIGKEKVPVVQAEPEAEFNDDVPF